jgi:DsbC/DsbD-like thiol-disulfide interchange protein/cytochrome c biogenesis protein CcdA
MLARLLIIVFAALTAAFLAVGAFAGSSAALEHVRLAAYLETPLVPGHTSWVAIRQQMDPGWHTYWRNPGESGLPTSVSWSLPAGVAAGAIRWPVPEQFSDGTVVNYGYSRDATLLVPLTASPSARPGMARLTVFLLACEHMCIPERATLELDLRKSSGGAGLFARARQAIPSPFTGSAAFVVAPLALKLTLQASQLEGVEANAVRFFPAQQGMLADGAMPRATIKGTRLIWRAQTQDGMKPPQQLAGVLQIAGKGSYWVTARPGPPLPRISDATAPVTMGLLTAIILALIGGLILNLMPCVLPVLSMKALALARTGYDGISARREGLFYLLGVTVTFALMAGVLLALKASGAALGWGFQLQSPAVVLVLALLMAAIGMNLLGAFELPMGFAGAGERLAQSGGWTGAFFTGALAVVVASPCTAPFMGAALGFALTQPIVPAVAVFLALGLGFALPFTVLSASPALIRLMPKPGPWMNTFKQALAFPMFATAIWLLWVLGRQAGPDAVVAGLAAGLGIVILVWLKRIARLVWPWLIGAAAVLSVAMVAVLAGGSSVRPAHRQWLPWSEQALVAARQSGRPVLVDFSAAWCVTCLVNERIALGNSEVQSRLQKDGVVTLKGDWTNPDPAITAALHSHGREGVPLYLLYPPQGSPAVLPQILTPGIVLAALSRMEAPASR